MFTHITACPGSSRCGEWGNISLGFYCKRRKIIIATPLPSKVYCIHCSIIKPYKATHRDCHENYKPRAGSSQTAQGTGSQVAEQSLGVADLLRLRAAHRPQPARSAAHSVAVCRRKLNGWLQRRGGNASRRGRHSGASWPCGERRTGARRGRRRHELGGRGGARVEHPGVAQCGVGRDAASWFVA